MRQDEYLTGTDERTYESDMDGRAEQPEPVDMDRDTEPATMDGVDRDTERGPQLTERAAGADDEAELFAAADVERFREEWQRIQTRFVDDPRDAVESADHLVDEVIRSLGEHKHDLEGQWQQGTDTQTEDLRLALRRYRSFFNQLINA